VNPSDTDTPYLTRLHLVHSPYGSIMLHWLTPDPQPDMHDHPVAFASFILRGGYLEETPNGEKVIRWLNLKRPTDLHRITSGTALTLVFAGPRRREWGFHTPEGWVHWKEYNG
jgi:hypothetical protein